MKTLSRIAVVAVLLAGCSKDPYEPYQKAFMLGCAQGGSTSQCECTFDKLKARYSPEQLAYYNDPNHVSQAFIDSNIQAALECR